MPDKLARHIRPIISRAKYAEGTRARNTHAPDVKSNYYQQQGLATVEMRARHAKKLARDKRARRTHQTHAQETRKRETSRSTTSWVWLRPHSPQQLRRKSPWLLLPVGSLMPDTCHIPPTVLPEITTPFKTNLLPKHLVAVEELAPRAACALRIAHFETGAPPACPPPLPSLPPRPTLPLTAPWLFRPPRIRL